MSSYPSEDSSTIVPTRALIAFVEAALALVNAGLAYLPAAELEHISAHLQHAVSLAAEAAQSRSISESHVPYYDSIDTTPPVSASHSPVSHLAASLFPSEIGPEFRHIAGTSTLEAQVKSLDIRGM